VSILSLEAVSVGSVALAVGSTLTLDDGGVDGAVDESSLEQDAPRRPTTTATVPRRRSVDA
jgi:hypothetical protein